MLSAPMNSDRSCLRNIEYFQTLVAGFSKQNYYEKIDKNQRKNIKITKLDRQGG